MIYGLWVKRYRVVFNLWVAGVWLWLNIVSLIELRFNFTSLKAYKNSSDIDRAPEALRTWSFMFGMVYTTVPFKSGLGKFAARLSKESLGDTDSLFIVWLKLRLNSKGNLGSLGNIGSAGHAYITTDRIPLKFRSGAALECILRKQPRIEICKSILDDTLALRIAVASNARPRQPFPLEVLSAEQIKLIKKCCREPLEFMKWIEDDSLEEHEDYEDDVRTSQDMFDRLTTTWDSHELFEFGADQFVTWCNDQRKSFPMAIETNAYDIVCNLVSHGLDLSLIDPEDAYLMSLSLKNNDIESTVASKCKYPGRYFFKKPSNAYSEDDVFEFQHYGRKRPWVALIQPQLSTEEMALALYQTRYGTAENFYPESPAFMSIIPHLCKHRPRIIQTLQQRYFKGDIAEPILPTIEAAVKQLEKMPRKFRWMSTQRLIERARTKNCIYSTEQLRRMDISKVLAAARTVDQSKFVARKIAVSSMVANRSDLPDIVREDLLMEDLGL